LTEIKSLFPEGIPFRVIELVIIIAVASGNVILFKVLFDKLKTRFLSGRKVIPAVISALLISVIVAMNILAIPSLSYQPIVVRTKLLSEITRAQQAGANSGFRVFANIQDSTEDVWTTAQALTALFSGGGVEPDKQRVVSAFNFIDSKQQSDGWYATPSGGPAFARTEISCWVAVAYLRSLQKTGFWNPEEWNKYADKAASVVLSIAEKQNKVTGGWGPISEIDS